jgi:hypothetical protein
MILSGVNLFNVLLLRQLDGGGKKNFSRVVIETSLYIRNLFNLWRKKNNYSLELVSKK